MILGLQRDHYLPLKVIKDYLADLDAGREPVLPGGGDAPKPSILGRERRYTRDETVRAAGASPMLLADAVSASLLPATDTYGDDGVSVLKALVELQRTGIEPRHLRTLRSTAEREVGLIESALMPVSRRGDATSRAKATEPRARDRRAPRDHPVEPHPPGHRPSRRMTPSGAPTGLVCQWPRRILDTPDAPGRMSRAGAVGVATVDLGTTLNPSLKLRVGARSSWKASS